MTLTPRRLLVTLIALALAGCSSAPAVEQPIEPTPPTVIYDGLTLPTLAPLWLRRPPPSACLLIDRSALPTTGAIYDDVTAFALPRLGRIDNQVLQADVSFIGGSQASYLWRINPFP